MVQYRPRPLYSTIVNADINECIKSSLLPDAPESEGRILTTSMTFPRVERAVSHLEGESSFVKLHDFPVFIDLPPQRAHRNATRGRGDTTTTIFNYHVGLQSWTIPSVGWTSVVGLDIQLVDLLDVGDNDIKWRFFHRIREDTRSESTIFAGGETFRDNEFGGSVVLGLISEDFAVELFREDGGISGGRVDLVQEWEGHPI